MFGIKTKTLLVLCLILIFGFWLRHKNIQDYNMVFDFDQYEDQYYTSTIAFDHNIAIIGRAVYGDPHLHHGVAYYYYNLLPFLLSSGNPLISAYWNIFFNVSTGIILFILARSIFGKVLPGIIAAIVAACSFEFIKFSSWLTIDTPAIFIIPLFFLGLWKFYQNKSWGLILAMISLGLALQTDLSFLYLIPIFIIFWAVFKPKTPNLKLFLLSILVFLLTTSTLILTEIKLNFSGVKSLINFSSTFKDTQLSFLDRISFFIKDFSRNFTNNLLPQRADLGIYIAGFIILSIFYLLFFKKESVQEKKGIYFLLLFLFAPAVTLLLGYHDKPWFLIGLSPAIALTFGYVISKLKSVYLILPIISLVVLSNTVFILNKSTEAYKLFDNIYDATSYLKFQIKVVDYTYKHSDGKPFAINAVTYPLYYNGMWAYLYNYYGKEKYGYLPGWLGGDQPHPYDLLPKAGSNQKIYYMIISETSRIPQIYKDQGRRVATESGKLLEEKKLDGFTILENYKQSLKF